MVLLALLSWRRKTAVPCHALKTALCHGGARGERVVRIVDPDTGTVPVQLPLSLYLAVSRAAVGGYCRSLLD